MAASVRRNAIGRCVEIQAVPADISASAIVSQPFSSAKVSASASAASVPVANSAIEACSPGRSSRLLQREFPALRKRYWGQHLWARGYYCASVGAVDEQTIRAYTENQRWDEDVDGFKITAPTEPGTWTSR